MSRLLKLALAALLVFSTICTGAFARKAFENQVELDSGSSQAHVRGGKDVRLRTLLDAESVDPRVYGYPGERERRAPAARRNRNHDRNRRQDRGERRQPKWSWNWWGN